MTKEEQRITIAEACGWKIVRRPKQKGVKWEGPNGEGCSGGGLYGWGFNDEPYLEALPDYLHDLNAMHKVESTLDANDKVRFYWMLAQVVNPLETADKCTFELIHATAAQRAEAFLRTIGKWMEDLP